MHTLRGTTNTSGCLRPLAGAARRDPAACRSIAVVHMRGSSSSNIRFMQGPAAPRGLRGLQRMGCAETHQCLRCQSRRVGDRFSRGCKFVCLASTHAVLTVLHVHGRAGVGWARGLSFGPVGRLATRGCRRQEPTREAPRPTAAYHKKLLQEIGPSSNGVTGVEVYAVIPPKPLAKQLSNCFQPYLMHAAQQSFVETLLQYLLVQRCWIKPALIAP